MTSSEHSLEWWQQAPPVLMPVPASEAASLTGRRVVVGDAERGLWVYEQRAVTEPHTLRGQQVVGVLDESVYWQTQDEPEFIAVPRSQPLATLWIEKPVDVGNVAPVAPSQDDLPKAARTKSLVVDPSKPPVRWLRFAPHELELTGARAWVLTADGPFYGLRILGEPRRHAFEGMIDFTKGLDALDAPLLRTGVPMCPELSWYRWRRTGVPPTDVEWYLTELVWLE